MISVEEKRAAYEEARQLLLLGKKWQQLMPGERKPDFKRAAKAVIRRALGKSTVPREPDLRVHSGLMHEHDAREASLVERTLRNGIVHPDVLHSFRHDVPGRPEQVPIGALTGGRQHVPLGEWRPSRASLNTDVDGLAPPVHAVHYPEDLEFPTHLNTRTQTFTAKHADHEFMHYMEPGQVVTEVPMRDRVQH